VHTSPPREKPSKSATYAIRSSPRAATQRQHYGFNSWIPPLLRLLQKGKKRAISGTVVTGDAPSYLSNGVSETFRWVDSPFVTDPLVLTQVVHLGAVVQVGRRNARRITGMPALSADTTSHRARDSSIGREAIGSRISLEVLRSVAELADAHA
jgi:hypothetical protein